MKAVVFTLGCKVNEVESAQIMAKLEAHGWEVSDKLSPADVYVLNTCAVTREAEKKSRQLVARARKISPEAPIYVCGCASEKNAGQFSARGVDFVCGARDKLAVADAIESRFNAVCQGGEELFAKQLKTRAFIKIQDGCNNFCSYCIIPYLRGRIVSRPLQDILDEVKAQSAKEIVFTGINISAYGRDSGASLTQLTDALAFTDKRVRLGSIECNVIDDGFLRSLKNLKDFAPQFHLSLQSGSNAVLERMNRKYTRETYLEKCALIYKYFPDAAITTDIIVGFCGESEEDFELSLSIIREAAFSRVHAFAYSPREGTRAYEWRDVPSDIKSQRLKRLLRAAKEAQDKYITSRLNTRQTVIFEEFDGEYTNGYTAGYIMVYVRGDFRGEKRDVILTEIFRDGAEGEITRDTV